MMIKSNFKNNRLKIYWDIKKVQLKINRWQIQFQKLKRIMMLKSFLLFIKFQFKFYKKLKMRIKKKKANAAHYLLEMD